MKIRFCHYMLCCIKGTKQKCSCETKLIYNDELFRHYKSKFFVTKNFITKGVVGKTISDEIHFIPECDK